MAVTSEKKSGTRFPQLSVLALGAALVALSSPALAQQDDHHHDGDGRGNGQPQQQRQQQQQQPQQRQQQASRPAPAAAPARAQGQGQGQGQPQAQAQVQFRGSVQSSAPTRGENGRNSGSWQGQSRPAQGNAAPNGWQQRGPQSNEAAVQGQPGQQRSYGVRTDGSRGAWNAQGRGDWHGNDGPGRGGPGYGDGGPGRGNPGYGNSGQWSHGWRQDNRYDWRGWREQNRDDFHAGRYYAPYRDYSYNRLGIGVYLQPLFFGSDYWISDTDYYHLPPAYGPYHWVRYYNDAIMVNTYSGQVADVIYDFFW